MALTIYQFPAQQKTLAEKTEQWGIICIDSAMTILYNDTSKVRKTKEAKRINCDLINGIIDEADIERAFNPMGIKGVSFPAKIQNYPIEASKFAVLKGEESRRRFDYALRSVNEDVISEKESMMKDQIYNLIVQEVLNAGYNEEKTKSRLKELDHYQKYEHQDYAEVTGTRILDYFWHTQKIKNIFSDIFYDVLVTGEEICTVDIIHGEPEVNKADVLGISTFGGSNSYKIEDHDIIIQEGYCSVGKIIDEFWDVLTSEEIKDLESGAMENRLSGNIVLTGPIGNENHNASTSQLITLSASDSFAYGSHFDLDGNIRKVRVIWKSRRKIGMLKYYDVKGTEQSTIVDEYFPIQNYKQYGWEVEWKWINEWWQGYLIGASIYKRIEPLPRIGSKFSNPSICLPPIVGTIYNISGGPGISLMDRIKPYKYLYNVYMRRTELASARNKGVFAELDLAEIPDGWDEELVMMYAEANGYMVKDSFKEGKKGQSMGKLIGTIKQRGSEAINLNSSDVIRANLELAKYVKNELAEVAGISPQREGQIDNRETLGGVERSVTQSSHITEEWFRLHDNTKIRVLELLLETAKYAWRNATGENVKKLQYIDDGLITHMFTVDGRKLTETEYGFYITDSRNDAELIQSIKQLSQAFIQNDKMTIHDLFTIYRDTSVSSMIRKLEASDEDQKQREDQARQEQLESNERIQESLNKIEQMKMEQEDRHELARIDADIYMKEIEIQAKLTEAQIKANPTGEDSKKLELELQKLKEQGNLKREEMDRKNREFKEKLKSDEKQNMLQIKSSEKIAAKRNSAISIKK